MAKLAFIIPTWNRPQHLSRCIESIASQVPDSDTVKVIVIDDASEDETRLKVEALQDTYPGIIEYQRRETHTDYSDVFQDMFDAGHCHDWAWTFGDDDLLQTGALAFMLEFLSTHDDLSFLHVPEVKRSHNTGALYRASGLFDLCNNFGWLEMTGFITGNITKGFLLAEAGNTPNWRTYAKSSFVQACALLEQLRDNACAFLDIPLVTSQEMEQTEDTGKRWSEGNIGYRYLLLADALELMYEQEILKRKVDKRFFRYLNYHLWDRFISHFLSDYFNAKTLWLDDAWGRVIRMTRFIANEEEATAIMADVEAARGLSTLGLYMSRNIAGIESELRTIFDRHTQPIYQYGFIGPDGTVALPKETAEPTSASTL